MADKDWLKSNDDLHKVKGVVHKNEKFVIIYSMETHPFPGRMLPSPVGLNFLIILQIVKMSIPTIKLISYSHSKICAAQQPFFNTSIMCSQIFPQVMDGYRNLACMSFHIKSWLIT